jgi:hypothetical protein
MTQQYVPGRGYTVRDSRGRVVAHSLSKPARDKLMSAPIVTQALLDAIGAL